MQYNLQEPSGQHAIVSGFGHTDSGEQVFNNSKLHSVEQRVEPWSTCKENAFGQYVRDELMDPNNVLEDSRTCYICATHVDGAHVGTTDSCQVGNFVMFVLSVHETVKITG